MSPQTRAILTELRSSLETIYGDRLVRLVLFGSQVRGDEVAGSDIDIMVVLKGLVSPGKEISRVGKATAALSLRYDVVISCTFVSEQRYDTEQSPLLMNVRKEGVPV